MKHDDNNVAIGLANKNLEKVIIPEYYLAVEDTDTTLLGKRINQEIEVKVPAGIIKLKILKIT